MALHTDIEFLGRIKGYFDIFRELGRGKYNVRCPFCGDSKSDVHKARGYFLERDDGLSYYCHNDNTCNTNFYGVLKRLNQDICNDYVRETFQSKGKRSVLRKKKEVGKLDMSSMIATTRNTYDFMGLLPLHQLPDDHIARKYAEGRQIPKEYMQRLFYTDNFKQVVESFDVPEMDLDRLPADERIIIPFYNEKREVEVFQGRALHDTHMRYITIKKHDDAIKCYGMDTLDKTMPIIVTEAPFDSMFLTNAVASADADLTRIHTLMPKDKNPIYVFDCQPRNFNLLRTIEKAVNNGYRVALLPFEFGIKDINEMIIDGMHTKESITSLIYSIAKQGLSAKLAFSEWRQIPTKNNNNKGGTHGKSTFNGFGKESNF